MTLDTMTTDTRYTVDRYPGIAWSFYGQETDLRETWFENEDGEWLFDEELDEVPTGFVKMVMVGDDRVFIVDPDDCTMIDDDAYCFECGQIGCTANG